jgi:signal transduction histidine kinase
MIRSRGWSLRSRLIVAFAAVTFLTLLLVGLGFLVIFREHLEQREVLRLSSLARQVSFQVQALERGGFSAAEIADILAQQADGLDARIVLASPQGLIFHDTESSLVGERIDVAGAQRLGSLRRARLIPASTPGDQTIFFIAVGGGNQGSSLPERLIGRQTSYLVALVSEPLTFLTVIRAMAPRLLLAAALSLLASIGFAWILAASIARPLARMTQAAEAIAQGQYDHEIPDRGDDEVGRLAVAFNTMAREVARSNRMLRDFLANVSHDLRTPLTSIQGFSQAMVDGTIRDRDEYAEAGRIVNEEAERMRRLVEDLLELSKIESGQVELDFAEVDLVGLVERTALRAERQADEKGAELTRSARASPLVRADAARLERVFDNLLMNAIRHTPAGGRVTITVDRTEDPAPRAVVSVHNTGSVIPSADLPRIFERFYQVDKSRAGTAVGSGLGLAIAREIVQAHGGRIVARSSPDDGTELIVTLSCLDPVPATALGSTPGRRPGPTADRVRAL